MAPIPPPTNDPNCVTPDCNCQPSVDLLTPRQPRDPHTGSGVWGGVRAQPGLTLVRPAAPHAGSTVKLMICRLVGQRGAFWAAKSNPCDGARALGGCPKRCDGHNAAAATFRVVTLCCAVPCRAVPCRAVLCRAVPCRAVPCYAVPCRAMPCRAMP